MEAGAGALPATAPRLSRQFLLGNQAANAPADAGETRICAPLEDTEAPSRIVANMGVDPDEEENEAAAQTERVRENEGEKTKGNGSTGETTRLGAGHVVGDANGWKADIDTDEIHPAPTGRTKNRRKTRSSGKGTVGMKTYTPRLTKKVTKTRTKRHTTAPLDRLLEQVTLQTDDQMQTRLR